jgi:hypothetical protein
LAKQLTNQFRIPPGGGMPIDIGGAGDIQKAIMPSPYKDVSPVFIQLIEGITQVAQRVGGTAELQVGEGKQDAPVGTTLAMIEQATKLMSAVHKRLHQAQAEEFGILKSLLQEDPEALWRHNKKSEVLRVLTQMAGQQLVVDVQEAAEDKHRATFLAALSDCELVPRADPNTSSQTERYLKVVAMRQLATTNPALDLTAVDRRAFQVMGIDDAESLFKPPPAPGEQPQPTPEMLTAQATIQAAQARMADANTRAAAMQAKTQADVASLGSKEKIAAMGVARELVIHNADQEAGRRELGLEAATQAAKLDSDAANQRASAAADAATAAAERSHQLRLANLTSARANVRHAAGLAAQREQGGVAATNEAVMSGAQMAHEARESRRERLFNLADRHLQRRADAAEAERQRQHDRALAAMQARSSGDGGVTE